VLQSRGVTVDDVGAVLRRLEPICAGLAAGRADREQSVLPVLEASHAQAQASFNDDVGFTAATQGFHQALVSCCGNQTLILAVGALESLWSARQEAWARRASGTEVFPSAQVRRSGLRAHERLIQLIRAGDSEGARAAAARHLDVIDTYTAGDGSEPVSVSLLNRWEAPRVGALRGPGLAAAARG